MYCWLIAGCVLTPDGKAASYVDSPTSANIVIHCIVCCNIYILVYITGLPRAGLVER